MDDTTAHGDRVFALVIAFIGAALALVGCIALGAEIALRRTHS